MGVVISRTQSLAHELYHQEMTEQNSIPRWCYVAIALLGVLVVWMGIALVRVENERYALAVGMCSYDMLKPEHMCNASVQTRTHWIWHIIFALFNW